MPVIWDKEHQTGIDRNNQKGLKLCLSDENAVWNWPEGGYHRSILIVQQDTQAQQKKLRIIWNSQQRQYTDAGKKE